MKVPESSAKTLLAFAALAAATLASSIAIGSRAYGILFLEAVLFVIYVALDARESMKRKAVQWGKSGEDVLFETGAAYFPGESDDEVDKGGPAGGEDGRLTATKSYLLFDADGGTQTAIRREKIQFVRKGIVREHGRKAQDGFSGVLLVVTTAGETHKFYAGDIDRWIRMLKYPTG